MKIVHCKDCPAEGKTDFADYAVNIGCLPSIGDMHKLHNETGRAWACHSKPTRICGGFLKSCIKNGKTVDFSLPLITEETKLDENN